MHHLQAVLTDFERDQAVRPVAVAPAGSADVVYVDESVSTATITAALKAWGLRVRAEREHGHGQAGAQGLATDESWATTRPHQRPASRLLNRRSPVWLPAIGGELADPADPLNTWFTRAA